MLDNKRKDKVTFAKPLSRVTEKAARKTPGNFFFRGAKIRVVDDNFIEITDLKDIIDLTTHQDWIKEKDGEYRAIEVNFYENKVDRVKEGELRFYVNKRYNKYDDIVNAEGKKKLIKLIIDNDGLKYRFAADNGIATNTDEDIVSDMIEYASFNSLLNWVTGVKKMLTPAQKKAIEEIKAGSDSEINN